MLPGLIDSHVHICAENGPNDKINRVSQTAADLAIDGAHFALITLRAGFTTAVADLGEENDAIFALRDGIAKGEVPERPRIIAAGNVDQPARRRGRRLRLSLGCHQDHRAAEPVLGRRDDCRRVVRQQVRSAGADVIKIVATGAVLSDAAQGVDKQFTDDELKAMVETAGICWAGGSPPTLNRRRRASTHFPAAPAATSIEHGTFMDDESIKLFKAHHAYYVPTLMAGYTVSRWANDPTSYLSPAARAKAFLVGPQMLKTARKAHDAGVLVAFGTDSSVSPRTARTRTSSCCWSRPASVRWKRSRPRRPPAPTTCSSRKISVRRCPANRRI